MSKEKKYIIWFLIVSIILPVYLNSLYAARVTLPHYEISFTPLWIPLDETSYNEALLNKLFDNTLWVAVGKFVIRMKDPLKIPILILRWHGAETLHIHSASLYKGTGYSCNATEQNLLADATLYNTDGNQELIFNLSSVKLHISNILYLVLTIPKNAQNILSSGSFELIPDALPSLLQKALKNQPLYISCAPFNGDSTSVRA